MDSFSIKKMIKRYYFVLIWIGIFPINTICFGQETKFNGKIEEYNFLGKIDSVIQFSYHAIAKDTTVVRWNNIYDKKYLITFDSKNRIIEKFVYNYPNKIIGLYNYKYNGDNIIEEKSIDALHNITYIINLKYDKNNRLIEKISSPKNGTIDKWVILNDYSQNTAIWKYVDSSNNDSENIDFKQYYKNGQIVKVEDNEHIRIYNYNENGKLINYTLDDRFKPITIDNGKVDSPIYFIEFHYDIHSNILSKISMYHGKIEEEKTFVYKYDEKGNWIIQIEYSKGTPIFIHERTIFYK